MKNILFYKKKAKAWEEALPVGNRRIGAMVFGKQKELPSTRTACGRVIQRI